MMRMIWYRFYIRIEVNGVRRPWIDFDGQSPSNYLQWFQVGLTNRLQGLDKFIAKMKDGLITEKRFFLYHESMSLDFNDDNEVHIYEDSQSEEILKLTIEDFKKFIYDYRAFLETYETSGIPGLPFVEQV